MANVPRRPTPSLDSLRHSEEKCCSLLEAMPDAIVAIDGTRKIIFVNREAERLFGYEHDELLNQPAELLLPDCFEPGSMHHPSPGQARNYPMPQGRDIHAVRKDRVKFPVEVTLSPIETSRGPVVIGVVRDITEDHASEAALRESEARLKEAQRIARISYWTWSPGGEFDWGDDACPCCRRDAGSPAVRCQGWTPSPTDEICPKLGTACPMHKLVQPFISARNEAATEETAEKFLAAPETFEREVEFVHRDGKHQWIVVRGRQEARGKDQRATLHGTIQDISERKGMEVQLRFAQRMEAVGRLAGGVAHDFNNMLNIIQGFGQMIGERVGSNDPILRMVDQIQKASSRAADLTKQLLAFSRQQVLQPTVMQINSVVSETEKMIRRVIGENIEMIVNLDPEAGVVKADQTQLAQVIVNLAVNARDAMPDGGKLVIATASARIDGSHKVQGVSMVPGKYVQLKVTDTGHGMDAETQARIFEPFFSTKEAGKGTGLGLASVYGTIKQSGGYIWVYSEIGNGSTFEVYLPQLELCAAERASSDTHAPPYSAGETVLIVDDEEGVRAVTSGFLSGAGYSVLEAANGSEALRMARKHSGPIHLAVVDVVMPGMSGRETMEHLTLLNPSIRVLYVSGYTNNGIRRPGVLEPDIAFLEKPFTKNALLCKVRELLDFSTTSKTI